MYTLMHIRLPGRQGLFANIRPELSPGQATRRLQLFNRLSALPEKVILPGHFSSIPYHRSFLLSDCSTFICTKSRITIQQLYSPWFNFFFLMQCPGKADTKAVSGLAITIRREAGVKILCDRTQSPERKRERDYSSGAPTTFSLGRPPLGNKSYSLVTCWA